MEYGNARWGLKDVPTCAVTLALTRWQLCDILAFGAPCTPHVNMGQMRAELDPVSETFPLMWKVAYSLRGTLKGIIAENTPSIDEKTKKVDKPGTYYTRVLLPRYEESGMSSIFTPLLL